MYHYGVRHPDVRGSVRPFGRMLCGKCCRSERLRRQNRPIRVLIRPHSLYNMPDSLLFTILFFCHIYSNI